MFRFCTNFQEREDHILKQINICITYNIAYYDLNVCFFVVFVIRENAEDSNKLLRGEMLQSKAAQRWFHVLSGLIHSWLKKTSILAPPELLHG